MGREKATRLHECRADLLVSGESGCLMNIAGVMDHEGMQQPRQHIAEFLWERVGKRTRP